MGGDTGPAVLFPALAPRQARARPEARAKSPEDKLVADSSPGEAGPPGAALRGGDCQLRPVAAAPGPRDGALTLFPSLGRARFAMQDGSGFCKPLKQCATRRARLPVPSQSGPFSSASPLENCRGKQSGDVVVSCQPYEAENGRYQEKLLSSLLFPAFPLLSRLGDTA